MKRQTLEEWQAEMKATFATKDEVAFSCPKCQRVSTIAEFKTHEIDEDLVAQNCIGRHVEGIGCDWCAGGLFRTLGKGRFVTLPDGREIQVFDFATPTTAEVH